MMLNFHRVYFLGAGGIGMSALARYFMKKGIPVAGYDRVSTSLTRQLEKEGMPIHYKDDIDLIPPDFTNETDTQVVYTPAIPPNHSELNYFRSNGFQVVKRSAVLGEITSQGSCVAVAGTHGKTTISGMIAHILHDSGYGCNAFLGGISVNYNSNYIFNPESDRFVVEADEFDRSFLQLFPDIALVTAIDADHLDVYKNHENLREAFYSFASQVKKGGVLIVKKGVRLKQPSGVKVLKYSHDSMADYFATEIRQEGLICSFTLNTPSAIYRNVKTGILGMINVENTIAALAVAMEAGVEPIQAIASAGSYQGIKRRFDVQINNDKIVYIDDYAHHPEELKAIILSVKAIFPGKRISGIFQPHLYSRTRDLAVEFAHSLSLLDDVVLLDIYPAREEPLDGVGSELIFKGLRNTGKKVMCGMKDAIDVAVKLNPEVILTLGAGDIDKITESLKVRLKESLL